ncbi:DUF4238 domain-containing protein [Clostridium sp. B9]|uniref:DUF4238 domain-containing protein n=1 Tax=Clostridium sp. B9 TaxID=3423224 RepID=UPI003D2F4663
MKDNITKKQHYIPRSYLKEFSKINDNSDDKKNKILVFDKLRKKSYGSNVYDIACENLFYEIENAPTITERQIFETTFSEMESKFLVLLKKFRRLCEEENNYFNALITTKEQRLEFSFYIVLQWIRTKKYRDIIRNFNDNAMTKIMKFYKEEFLGEKFDTNNKGYKIDEKIMHLNSLLDSNYIGALTNFISNSHWMFIKNETQTPFITSDNPVCRIPKYYVDEIYGEKIYPIFSDTLEINFPLSPNILLRIFRNQTSNYEKLKKFRNRVVPVKEIEMVDIINQFQCIMANEKIFINPEYKNLLEKYTKEDLLKEINLIM